MPKRASFRHDSGPPSPRTFGSTADSGRRTPDSTSSEVTDARSDILLVIFGAENPGVSVGTTNPRIPSSVCAQTTATSAIDPLVIHIFVPSSTQSEPSRRTRVRMPAGSAPIHWYAGPNGVYVDDVYLSAPGVQNFSMFDISQVQVLKGPQGTLYGRNTSGGALLFTSNKPTDYFTADAVMSAPDLSDPKIGESIFAAHAVLIRPKFEWLSEALLDRHAPFGSSIVFHTPGFYTQISRQIGSYRPYFRYEYLNVAHNEPVFPDVALRHGPLFGIRYDATEAVALKFQYNYTFLRNQPGVTGLTAQVGFTF